MVVAAGVVETGPLPWLELAKTAMPAARPRMPAASRTPPISMSAFFTPAGLPGAKGPASVAAKALETNNELAKTRAMGDRMQNSGIKIARIVTGEGYKSLESGNSWPKYDPTRRPGLTNLKPVRAKISPMEAFLPPDEADRLIALENQKITDTPADDSFDRIVRLACAAISAPVGAISFVDGDRQWFKARQNLTVCETPRRDAFCVHALHSDQVLVVEDATKDPRFSDNPLVTCEDGIRFYAGAPLQMPDGFILGTLCVIDHIPRRIEQRDISLLKDMAAIVVDELELRRRAGTDALTGLYNRRLLSELAIHEIARARRSSQPFTAALIDIDKFKTVNDTFGHAAGDAVLRAIGPACRAALRTPDLLARYGGEEIAVLLPNTSLEQAAPVLERLRASIMAMLVPELKGRWVVTASIGAAQLQCDDADLDAMLSRADAALYRAKESGRNRVELDLAA